MVLRRFAAALVALVLLAGCVSTQPGVNALQPTPDPADAVARITYRDGSVEYISQKTLDQYRTQLYGAPQNPAPADQILNLLIARNLLLRQARNQDIAADPQDIERTIENVRSNPQLCSGRIQQSGQSPQESDPRALLDQCAQSFGFQDGNAFRSFLADELTIAKVAQQNAPKDQIKVAHILFDKNEEGYTKAADTYAQICGTPGSATTPEPQRCEGAANFSTLAKQLSIEPAAKQSGGDLPPFNEQGLTDQGQPFDSTFVSNTWALKQEFLDNGVAISRPFETDFGWHIVKVEALQASQRSAQEYENAIVQRALQAKPADLQQPDQGSVPLLGAVEILKPLPTPEPVPSLEPALPEELASPEATSVVPAEGTSPAEPEATTTTTP